MLVLGSVVSIEVGVVTQSVSVITALKIVVLVGSKLI